MAFDKPTRNRLASFVGKARDLIADEFTQQFQGLYGISDKGTITPLEQLGHLDDMGLATASLLRERIDYIVKTHPNDREGIKAAVARLAREQAFTVLNRLAAIRMAEKRSLIVESVGKGYQSKGFKVFEQVAGAGLGDTYRRYCRYLFCLFDELAVDLGVLFDRRSPQGLIFPGETALQALFTLLNAPDLDPLWAEDETIGWIYQYYNDPAERKKMRDESAAPRNSRELAVRNQFFTPRYVVEFLTDNTLGRIWYEMTQGKTRLKNQCRYLVRRPTEIFLKPGETAPENTSQEGISQEELLKQPVYIPHRPLKDPRKIGLLDPACGSMHFGLYAFDLFEAIYEEAWGLNLPSPSGRGDVGEGLSPLRDIYATKDDYLRDVPRLIIEHNIHGIDIDPRATQIAGLSLWLRAQKSWQAQRVPAAQRPRIMRSNIVCAEPMPGSPELLKEFTATLHPPLLGQLVEKVFTQMQLAGEAGSLLKIEEEIAGLVKEAKKFWKTRPKAEQTVLSLGQEAKPKQGEFPLDVSGISDEHFWETAEERIYAALHTYTEQTESGRYQRNLFAEDAARGFAFIDLCRKRYDVVLMNPPFGEFSKQWKVSAKKIYPCSANDILAAFVDSFLKRLTEKGLLGAITSRTCFFLSSFQTWREEVILESASPVIMADLGAGVMDAALVEATAYVIEKEKTIDNLHCVRLISSKDRAVGLLDALQSMNRGVPSHDYFCVRTADFRLIPGSPFAYWVTDRIRSLFTQCACFETDRRTVRNGLATADDFRFTRSYWEIPSANFRDIWFPFAKGGRFSQFYADLPVVVNWALDGLEVKALIIQRYPYLNGNAGFVAKNTDYYFKAGLTWPLRAHSFSPQIMPKGCIFSVRGYAVIADENELPVLLGLTSSDTFDYLFKILLGRFGFPEFIVGVMQKLPVPEISNDLKEEISGLVRESWALKRSIASSVLTSNAFSLPPLLSLSGDKLRSRIRAWTERIEVTDARLLDYKQVLNELALKAYGLSIGDLGAVKEESETESHGSDEGENESAEMMEIAGSDQDLTSSLFDYFVGGAFGRWDIRFATCEKPAPELPDPFAPLPVCSPAMLQNADGLPAESKDVPANYPLRISWPGILVDDENHPEDIVARVREVLEVIWKERADAIEQEACELLGVKTLRDYFCRPAGFFAVHLKRYSKSRRQAPIYWPLSTAKGTYTLWIYYHRLTDQTLHTALADFVDPKLKAVRAEIIALRESGNYRNRLEELLDLEKELADFHAETEDIIKLPYKPNLNDGVLITASPLWKLFRFPKWQKDLKACWDKLEKGDYDWAHLAYSIWPKRVEEACKKDRSIAIAHNLEHLCETVPPKAKGKKKRKVTAPEESEP